MAVPAFRDSTAQNGAGGNATTATCNQPTGTAENDILIFVLYRERDTPTEDVTWPTDFTEFGEALEAGPNPDMVMSVAWKRAGGSEPADYTASWASSSYREARLAAFSGCKTSDSPFNVAGSVTSNAANQTNLVLPQVTTTVDECLLVAAAVAFGGVSYTEPVTMSQRIDANVFGLCDEDFASAGATGTRTYARNANSYQLGILFALEPPAAMAPTFTITAATLSLYPLQLAATGEISIPESEAAAASGSRRVMGQQSGGSVRVL